MNITPQQAAAIKKLVRRANRRIERASGGQKSALEYMVMKTTGKQKFSASTKGLTFEQAAMKLKQLDKFLGAETTTISGWKKVKAENVSRAVDTLNAQNYEITDEEFEEILEQVDTKNKQEFYRAINLVSAAKAQAGEDWTGSKGQIAEAIAEKVSFQQALQRAIESRRK